jgi:hypothetical protein
VNIIDGPIDSSKATRASGTGLEENFLAEGRLSGRGLDSPAWFACIDANAAKFEIAVRGRSTDEVLDKLSGDFERRMVFVSGNFWSN